MHDWDPPLGEYPSFPPDIVCLLHERTSALRHRLADHAWQLAADGAVAMFESWKGRLGG